MSKQITLLLFCACLSSQAFGWENFCKSSGVFPHPEDCTSFVTCHGSQKSGYKMRTHRCPEGQAFSDLEMKCIPLAESSDCEREVLSMYTPKVSDPLCQDVAVHCANCTHLVYCQLEGGEYQNPIFLDCAESSASFCDQNMLSCSDQLPSEGCDLPGFACTSPGYFPDPTNCDIYHVCYEDNEYDSFRCADASMPQYLSPEFRCGADNDTTVCEPVTCDAVGVHAFPRDPRYYVMCLSELEIYSCEGNTEFISNTELCQFRCHEAGLFPSVFDPNSYYRCEATADPDVFEITNETCPNGLSFNPVARSCSDIDPNAP